MAATLTAGIDVWINLYDHITKWNEVRHQVYTIVAWSNPKPWLRVMLTMRCVRNKINPLIWKVILDVKPWLPMRSGITDEVWLYLSPFSSSPLAREKGHQVGLIYFWARLGCCWGLDILVPSRILMVWELLGDSKDRTHNKMEQLSRKLKFR